MNLAASKPNIGRPICVSDSLIDFFFRKTFSPLVDTTLNSILPEKVAVRDLQKRLEDNDVRRENRSLTLIPAPTILKRVPRPHNLYRWDINRAAE